MDYLIDWVKVGGWVGGHGDGECRFLFYCVYKETERERKMSRRVSV